MTFNKKPTLVLGIETSCDETGVALYHSEEGLLANALHSQVAMHEDYGGVVPELASRDHIRRVLPLTQRVLNDANKKLTDLDAIAYTQGPGLAGALLVGASIANALAFALHIPALGIHHLEGHLLSPMLSQNPPTFPFIALLVSGGHTQLMKVERLGCYKLLGETLDDAAGEAFDKTAKLLGLGYPGGPSLAKLAEKGYKKRFNLPRPMLNSPDFDFSFSGLKTAVMTLVKEHAQHLTEQTKADLACEFQSAIVEVLVKKSITACDETNLKQLVVAGGVGANQHLRQELNYAANKKGIKVFYPELEFCTDNGAMIAYVGNLKVSSSSFLVSSSNISARSAQRETRNQKPETYAFTVKPRWDL